MITYQVSAGWNTTSWVTLNPQPAQPNNVNWAEVYATDGSVNNEGYGMADLVWSNAILSSELVALDTAFGTSATTRYAQVSIRLLGSDRTTLVTYNAIVVRPVKLTYKNGFYRDVIYAIRNVQ